MNRLGTNLFDCYSFGRDSRHIIVLTQFNNTIIFTYPLPVYCRRPLSWALDDIGTEIYKSVIWNA